MKRSQSILSFSALLVLALGLASCSVQPCYQDTDPLMNGLLLTSGTGETAKADSLRIRGVTSTDTIELIDAISTSVFSVPMDPAEDYSLFFITLNGVSDTVEINYTREPHLVSPECGYTILSEITGLKTTHYIIATLSMQNKIVNLNGEKNLHLFY